jgi:hypothetical protein
LYTQESEAIPAGDPLCFEKRRLFREWDFSPPMEKNEGELRPFHSSEKKKKGPRNQEEKKGGGVSS